MPWVTFPIVHLLPSNSRGRGATQYPLLQTLFRHESAHHVDFFSRLPWHSIDSVATANSFGYGQIAARDGTEGKSLGLEESWRRKIQRNFIISLFSFVINLPSVPTASGSKAEAVEEADNDDQDHEIVAWHMSRDNLTCSDAHVLRDWYSLLPSGTLCCRLAQGNAKCHW